MTHRIMVVLFVSCLMLGCSSEVDSGLTPDQAKVNLLDKVELQLGKLVETTNGGTVPDSTGRLPREVGALKGKLDPALGEALFKQTEELDKLIDSGKPSLDAVKAKLDEISKTVAEIKAKG